MWTVPSAPGLIAVLDRMKKAGELPEYLILKTSVMMAPAGWQRELGDGRFVYLAPGHTPEALNHPMMQRLIRNAARWLTRLDEK